MLLQNWFTHQHKSPLEKAKLQLVFTLFLKLLFTLFVAYSIFIVFLFLFNSSTLVLCTDLSAGLDVFRSDHWMEMKEADTLEPLTNEDIRFVFDVQPGIPVGHPSTIALIGPNVSLSDYENYSNAYFGIQNKLESNIPSNLGVYPAGNGHTFQEAFGRWIATNYNGNINSFIDEVWRRSQHVIPRGFVYDPSYFREAASYQVLVDPKEKALAKNCIAHLLRTGELTYKGVLRRPPVSTPTTLIDLAREYNSTPEKVSLVLQKLFKTNNSPLPLSPEDSFELIMSYKTRFIYMNPDPNLQRMLSNMYIDLVNNEGLLNNRKVMQYTDSIVRYLIRANMLDKKGDFNPWVNSGVTLNVFTSEKYNMLTKDIVTILENLFGTANIFPYKILTVEVGGIEKRYMNPAAPDEIDFASLKYDQYIRYQLELDPVLRKCRLKLRHGENLSDEEMLSLWKRLKFITPLENTPDPEDVDSMRNAALKRNIIDYLSCTGEYVDGYYQPRSKAPTTLEDLTAEFHKPKAKVALALQNIFGVQPLPTTTSLERVILEVYFFNLNSRDQQVVTSWINDDLQPFMDIFSEFIQVLGGSKQDMLSSKDLNYSKSLLLKIETPTLTKLLENFFTIQSVLVYLRITEELTSFGGLNLDPDCPTVAKEMVSVFQQDPEKIQQVVNALFGVELPLDRHSAKNFIHPTNPRIKPESLVNMIKFVDFYLYKWMSLELRVELFPHASHMFKCMLDPAYLQSLEDIQD